MEAFIFSGAADILIGCLVAFVVSTTRFAGASPAAKCIWSTVIGHAILIFQTRIGSKAGASGFRTITFAFTAGAGEFVPVIVPAAGIGHVATIVTFHTRTEEADEASTGNGGKGQRVAEIIHAIIIFLTTSIAEGDLALTVVTQIGSANLII